MIIELGKCILMENAQFPSLSMKQKFYSDYSLWECSFAEVGKESRIWSHGTWAGASNLLRTIHSLRESGTNKQAIGNSQEEVVGSCWHKCYLNICNSTLSSSTEVETTQTHKKVRAEYSLILKLGDRFPVQEQIVAWGDTHSSWSPLLLCTPWLGFQLKLLQVERGTLSPDSSLSWQTSHPHPSTPSGPISPRSISESTLGCRRRRKRQGIWGVWMKILLTMEILGGSQAL